MRACINVKLGNFEIRDFFKVCISQNLNDHHTIVLEISQSYVNQSLGLSVMESAKRQFYAKKISVVLTHPTEEKALFEGIFITTRIVLDHKNSSVIIKGYSPTYLLDISSQNQTFCDNSLDEILEEVIGSAMSCCGSTYKNETHYVFSVNYLCRFNETSWNFLKKMGNMFGFFTSFKKNELCLKPWYKSMAEEADLPVLECSSIRWISQFKIIPAGIKTYDYTSNKEIQAHFPTKEIDTNGSYINELYKMGTSFLSYAGNQYSFPSGETIDKNAMEQSVKAKAASLASSLSVVTARSSSFIEPADRVTIKNADEENEKITITKVTHFIDPNGNYFNYFEGTTSSYYYPGSSPAYTTSFTSPLQAKVITIDPDNKKIKVAFAGWHRGLEQQNSGWIPMLSPLAGTGKKGGIIFLPEIGDVVIVNFLYGNVHLPYVQSAISSGTHNIGTGMSNQIKSIMNINGSGFISHALNNYTGLVNKKGQGLIFSGMDLLSGDKYEQSDSDPSTIGARLIKPPPTLPYNPNREVKPSTLFFNSNFLTPPAATMAAAVSSRILFDMSISADDNEERKLLKKNTRIELTNNGLIMYAKNITINGTRSVITTVREEEDGYVIEQEEGKSYYEIGGKIAGGSVRIQSGGKGSMNNTLSLSAVIEKNGEASEKEGEVYMEAVRFLTFYSDNLAVVRGEQLVFNAPGGMFIAGRKVYLNSYDKKGLKFDKRKKS